LVLSPTGSINLGFTTEGRLAAVLIIHSLGVPNWSVIYINTAPSTCTITILINDGVMLRHPVGNPKKKV
jgi:hypothetical protein